MFSHRSLTTLTAIWMRAYDDDYRNRISMGVWGSYVQVDGNRYVASSKTPSTGLWWRTTPLASRRLKVRSDISPQFFFDFFVYAYSYVISIQSVKLRSAHPWTLILRTTSPVWMGNTHKWVHWYDQRDRLSVSG